MLWIFHTKDTLLLNLQIDSNDLEETLFREKYIIIFITWIYFAMLCFCIQTYCFKFRGAKNSWAKRRPPLICTFELDEWRNTFRPMSLRGSKLKGRLIFVKKNHWNSAIGRTVKGTQKKINLHDHNFFFFFLIPDSFVQNMKFYLLLFHFR